MTLWVALSGSSSSVSLPETPTRSEHRVIDLELENLAKEKVSDIESWISFFGSFVRMVAR